jgi:hypothetical protein
MVKAEVQEGNSSYSRAFQSFGYITSTNIGQSMLYSEPKSQGRKTYSPHTDGQLLGYMVKRVDMGRYEEWQPIV